MILKLTIHHLKEILGILQQDALRFCDGEFPSEAKISHYISDSKCLAFGIFENDELKSLIIAEKLSYNGVIVWYLATKSNQQQKGYANSLLDFFESHIKELNLNWIFLNSTSNALNFYKKHGYLTSEYSTVYEHVKYLK